MADCGKYWDRTSVYKECESTFLFERAKAEFFQKDAEKEKQEGIQGQWQQESPAKEFLDQVKSSADTDCTSSQDGGVWILCIKRRAFG